MKTKQTDLFKNGQPARKPFLVSRRRPDLKRLSEWSQRVREALDEGPDGRELQIEVRKPYVD